MIEVQVHSLVGDFAEDKDAARSLREQTLLPALRRGDEVALDFSGIDFATQSFVHALISEALRDESLRALDLLLFRSCAPAVRSIIEVVVEYSQAALAESKSDQADDALADPPQST